MHRIPDINLVKLIFNIEMSEEDYLHKNKSEIFQIKNRCLTILNYMKKLLVDSEGMDMMIEALSQCDFDKRMKELRMIKMILMNGRMG